jgi:hypothetical protein
VRFIAPVNNAASRCHFFNLIERVYQHIVIPHLVQIRLPVAPDYCYVIPASIVVVRAMKRLVNIRY